MKVIFMACLFLLLVSGAAVAQLKTGGRKINTQKLVRAGSDAVQAATLSDEDIVSISREYREWLDARNPVLSDDSELGKCVNRLITGLRGCDGLSPDIRAYEAADVNAFACDGSIRVCAGWMEAMDAAEVWTVIGHEIGDVKYTNTKRAMKFAMANALNKLVEISKAGGEKASRSRQMFSTHPDSEKRAARMKEKADEYTRSHP